MGMAQLQPGPHLYHDGIGNPPVPVDLRWVDSKQRVLGVFFEACQGLDDLWEPGGAVGAVLRAQLHLASVDAGTAAVAVELELV